MDKRRRTDITEKDLYKYRVKEGLKISEIAEIYGCCPRTITVRCHEFGIKTSRKDIRELITREEFEEMYVNQRMSLKQILKRYNTTYSKNLSDQAKEWGFDISRGNRTLTRESHDRKRRHHPNLAGVVLTKIKDRLKRGRGRVLDCTITLDDIWEKYLEQNKLCALTGEVVYFPKTSKDYAKSEYTASVDRIDSDQGYTQENIQVVHKDLNRMKWDLSQDQFIEYCRKVANLHKESP